MRALDDGAAPARRIELNDAVFLAQSRGRGILGCTPTFDRCDASGVGC